MVGQHHQLSGHECEQTPGDGEGQGSLECYSPWGCKQSDRTEHPNNKDGRNSTMSGHLTISRLTEGHLVGTSQPPKLTTEGVQVIHKGWIKAPLKTGYLGKHSPSLIVLGLPSSTQRHHLWDAGHPQSGFHHKHSPPGSLRCLHQLETSLSHPETQDR